MAAKKTSTSKPTSSKESKPTSSPAVAAKPQRSEADLKHARAFLSVFERRNTDGTYYYSDDDVRAFVPLLAFSAGSALPDPLPPDLLAVMQEFGREAGIADGASPEQVQKAVDAWYKKHPLNAELLAAFKGIVVETLAEDGGSKAAGQARKAVGGDDGGKLPVSARGPAPAGAVKAAMWRLNPESVPPNRPNKSKR